MYVAKTTEKRCNYVFIAVENILTKYTLENSNKPKTFFFIIKYNPLS